MRLRLLIAAYGYLILAACQRQSASPGADGAVHLPELKVTVFAAPSQSIWLPTLIKTLKLDEKQGFSLVVTAKPGQVAYTDFASGADPVCYCAAPAAVARFVEQGAQITLLWNVFDLDYYIVTNNAAIQRPSDLNGKTIGADTSTGVWATAVWLLKQNGVHIDQLDVQSATTPSLIAAMGSGRLDAAVFGPIDSASLMAAPGGDQFRLIKINQESDWRRYGLEHGIPSIEFGTWRTWLEKPENLQLARKFYRANLEAAAFLRKDPAQAAKIIGAATSISEDALRHLFADGAPMIDIRPSSEYAPAIKLLTQQLMPAAHQLDRPLTDAELTAYVSDFQP